MAELTHPQPVPPGQLPPLRRFLRALTHPLHRWMVHYRPELLTVLFILSAAFIFFLPAIVYTIPAGHVGVHWKRFFGGTVTDHVFHEGLRLIFPWDKIYIYDARLQQVERQVHALSSDGLDISMDLVWRFRIRPEAAGKLHKYVGTNYQETLVAPTISARARDVIALFRPEEIYTEHRLTIQEEISRSVRYDLSKRFNPEGTGDPDWFVFEDILIKSITLPPGVQEAIVHKNAAYHEMQEYTFRIQKEHKEAERKRIEAVGIRNFQEIISGSMTDSCLRWRGIEATLALANSPNSKVVVIGSGRNGMPLILNTDSRDTQTSQVGDSFPGASPAVSGKAPARPATARGGDRAPRSEVARPDDTRVAQNATPGGPEAETAGATGPGTAAAGSGASGSAPGATPGAPGTPGTQPGPAAPGGPLRFLPPGLSQYLAPTPARH